MENKKIKIYTDGAARGNPGRGGWAVIVIADEDEKEFGGNIRLRVISIY